MARRVSDQRKAAFYVGTTLIVLGFLFFLSVPFSAFTDRGTGFAVGRFFAGLIMMIAGRGLRTVGARGLAGSGLVLDPEQARGDLEPYSRMAGGMVKDALEETGLGGGARQPERVVMLKCRACGRLNEEDSKFCQECGQPM